VQREPIYQALLGQLQQLQAPSSSYAATWPSLVVSRGFVHWEDATVQPAIYIVPVKETAIYKKGLPTKWMVEVELYLYVRADSIDLGVQNLSALLDAVDATLSVFNTTNAGGPTFANTLGNLAVYCAIQGAIDISGGFLNGQQAVARVPIEIMVA
jgi:hypothetical protein